MILPDHPLDLVAPASCEALGFTRFVETKTNEPLDLDGLRVMTVCTIFPADGPLGDSALAVDDGEIRIFDQNDARPVDLDGDARVRPLRRALRPVLRARSGTRWSTASRRR